MADLGGLDWPGVFRSLRNDDVRTLAFWLADLELQVGEFMEVVDRAYAGAPEPWRGQPQAFMLQIGQPAAQCYALRKRRYAHLMALLEEALASGALAGEVAPRELEFPVAPRPKPRPAEELAGALERAKRGQE
jgi:hypothetical protein